MPKFRDEYTTDQIKKEAMKIKSKYPGRIPVIVEPAAKSMFTQELPDLDKKKYLVPVDIAFSQFQHIIRKRIKLSETKAIFLMANNAMITGSMLMSDVYEQYGDKESGFLFLDLQSESVFG